MLGAERPEALEFIQKFAEKAMETRNVWKFLINYERILYFQKPIYKSHLWIKIKVSLMVSCNSLVNLKGIKKYSGKYFRVWAKNK